MRRLKNQPIRLDKRLKRNWKTYIAPCGTQPPWGSEGKLVNDPSERESWQLQGQGCMGGEGSGCTVMQGGGCTCGAEKESEMVLIKER